MQNNVCSTAGVTFFECKSSVGGWLDLWLGGWLYSQESLIPLKKKKSKGTLKVKSSKKDYFLGLNTFLNLMQ